jgi:hypothetical protein
LSTIDININVNLDNEYFIKKEIDKDILKKWVKQYRFSGFEKYIDEVQNSLF